MKLSRYKHSLPAFTIVELLVVIAVIAILAVLSVVAYLGITNQAHVASLSSGLADSAKALENYKVSNTITNTETYPAKLSDLTNLKLDNSINWTYYVQSSTDSTQNTTYCLQGTINNLTQSVSSSNPTVATKPCIENGLVGWWKLNGDATDSSGNGNNGAISGATLAAGQNGLDNSSYSFNGVNNYIRTNNISTVFNDGTLSFWCYTNGRASGTAGTNLEGKVKMPSFRPLVYDVGRAGVYWNGASPTAYPASVILPDLTWSYVALTWTNAGSGSNNGAIKLYLNSALQKSVTNLLLPVGVSDSIYIGQYSSLAGYNPYYGRIDDVRTYNRTLSPSEISALYAAGAQ